MQTWGSIGSTALLCAFYFSIGLNCRIGDFVQIGGPLLFLIVYILGTNLLTLVVGTKVWNTFVPKKYSIDIDTACIASNAAVGGAATAASYASIIGKSS